MRRPAWPTPPTSAPSCEFFVFDDVRYDLAVNEAYYHVDSAEGALEPAAVPEPRLQDPRRRATSRCLRTDRLADLRTEMCSRRVRHPVRVHHHEVATGGQCEIDLRYQPLVEQPTRS